MVSLVLDNGYYLMNVVVPTYGSFFVVTRNAAAQYVKQEVHRTSAETNDDISRNGESY